MIGVRAHRVGRPPFVGRQPRRGITLAEVLVTVSITSILVAILVPALGSGREAARSLKCRAQMRQVTLAFMEFAGRTARHGDGELWGEGTFRLEDFQESIYQIHEFWQGPEGLERVRIEAAGQPLMCPAGPALLERRAEMPCSAGAIGPQANVSTGFNKRLETKTRLINGNPMPQRVYLNEKILMSPDVPLVADVDGGAAVDRNVVPYYLAPPLPKDRPQDIYSGGQNWIPSFRHRGQINVAFVGGHVLSSRSPLTEPWWRWSFQPD